MVSLPKLCPPMQPLGVECKQHLAIDGRSGSPQNQPCFMLSLDKTRPKKPQLMVATGARASMTKFPQNTYTEPDSMNTDDDERIAVFSEQKRQHSTEPSSPGGNDSLGSLSSLSDSESDSQERSGARARSKSTSGSVATDMRRQALVGDLCIVAMTATSVKCGLCERWFQLGPGYKNMYNWTNHKRKCPYLALQSMFARQPGTPVQFFQRTTESSVTIDDADPDAERLRNDPRVRDFNALKVQCDFCGLWRPKDTWDSHRCRWQPQDCGDDAATESTAVASTSDRSASPDILAKLPKLVAFPDADVPVLTPVEPTPSLSPVEPASRSPVSLLPPEPTPPPTLCERVLADVKRNSFDAYPGVTIDYAERYSRYLDPDPAPRYAFQHTGRPVGGLHLQPATFDEDEEDSDEDDTVLHTPRTPRVARTLTPIDIDVLMESSTRHFLAQRRKPPCSIPGPAVSSVASDTVGMSIRQLVASRISPFTF